MPTSRGVQEVGRHPSRTTNGRKAVPSPRYDGDPGRVMRKATSRLEVGQVRWAAELDRGGRSACWGRIPPTWCAAEIRGDYFLDPTGRNSDHRGNRRGGEWKAARASARASKSRDRGLFGPRAANGGCEQVIWRDSRARPWITGLLHQTHTNPRRRCPQVLPKTTTSVRT